MTITTIPPDLAANGLRSSTPTPAPKPATTGNVVPREVHNFLSDVEHLIEETTSISGDDLARAKAKLGERISKARHAVAEKSDALMKETRRNADIANRYVHERPWTMIGIAAAVGGLLGFLLARSR